MSNAPTAVEIAEKICTGVDWQGLAIQEVEKILAEWAKQLQPQSDSSAIDLLMEIFSKHPDIGKRDDLQNDILDAMHRHTEAKCAEAWRMGADATRKLIVYELHRRFIGKIHGEDMATVIGFIGAIHIPEYQRKK